MQFLKTVTLLTSILGAGALFGFYFTMSVSIMPGLDATDPYAAIVANQDIGRANKESFFFVALLGTPIAMLVGLALHWRSNAQRLWIILALLGWVGMLIITLTLSVPLNNVLDGLSVTPNQGGLADIWAAYGVDWQKWNWVRVLTSGLSLVFVALALQSHATWGAQESGSLQGSEKR